MVVEKGYKHYIDEVVEVVELGLAWLNMGLFRPMQYMDEGFVVELENHRQKLQALVDQNMYFGGDDQFVVVELGIAWEEDCQFQVEAVVSLMEYEGQDLFGGMAVGSLIVGVADRGMVDNSLIAEVVGWDMVDDSLTVEAVDQDIVDGSLIVEVVDQDMAGDCLIEEVVDLELQRKKGLVHYAEEDNRQMEMVAADMVVLHRISISIFINI